MTARHRAPDQPDRHPDDRSRDRRGAHEPARPPFTGATLPAADLLRRLHREDPR